MKVEKKEKNVGKHNTKNNDRTRSRRDTKGKRDENQSRMSLNDLLSSLRDTEKVRSIVNNTLK